MAPAPLVAPVPPSALLLTGLGPEVTVERVRAALRGFGPVADARLFALGGGRGAAVVRFAEPDAAERVMREHAALRDRGQLAVFTPQALEAALKAPEPPPPPPSAESAPKPADLARLLASPATLSARLQHAAQASSLAGVALTLRVREVRLDRLPPEATAEFLRRQLAIFGEVDNVEVRERPRRRAFVRFRRAAAAEACLDSRRALQTRVGAGVCVAAADPRKRSHVVGNDVRLDDAAQLPVVFVGLARGAALPSAAALKRAMGAFGPRSVLLRPAVAHGRRPFALLELDGCPQAHSAAHFFGPGDRDGRRRAALGAGDVEVSVVLRGAPAADPAAVLGPALLACLPPAAPAPAWTGFLCCHGREQLGVDAFAAGDAPPLPDSVASLNVTHRVALVDLQQTLPLSAAVLRPAATVYAPAFAQLRERCASAGVGGVVTHLDRAVALVLPVSAFVLGVLPAARRGDLALLVYADTTRFSLSVKGLEPWAQD